MKPIVTVENLSKQYRIGARPTSHATLREMLVGAVQSPLKRLRRNGHAVDEATLWALQDVSFEVKPGEVVGIIGRNGAGKSTLLKILSRITEPTSGRVKLYGRVGSLLEVGTGFHPELTGRENVFLNGAILGMARTEIDRKFDEIVSFSGVEKFIDTPVKHYSSGMYLRLAFAVAAHLEPEILIVDEVLAVGDMAFQKKCVGKMRDVSRAGRTVLFVSHNMEAVRKLCDWAILLSEGRVDCTGGTDKVLKKYVEGDLEAQSTYAIPAPSDPDAPGYAYKLVIENVDGKPATAVPVGRPWQIRVHFRINKKIQHFVIGLGLLTREDMALRTSWSFPQSIDPGDYQVVFRESTVILGTGRYPLLVGLSSDERPFHYAENIGALDVAEFSEGIDLMRLSNVGLILNPLSIEIQQLNDSSGFDASK